MKKSVARVLALILAISMCVSILAVALVSRVSADDKNIGDVIDCTHHTDIVATIDGYDIAGFNMNDYTYVVAEDLRNYGFDVQWNAQDRTLHISKVIGKVCETNYITPFKDRMILGKVAHEVYMTDISTYLDGVLVESFNIGGWTIIPFDALGKYGDVTYNNDARRLNLDLFDTQSSLSEYDKILAGDFSDYSGVYENAEGDIIDLRYDGTEVSEYITEKGKAVDIQKNTDGHYSWAVEFECDGYAFWLYPVGVEVYTAYSRIPTDTTKVRLYAGHDFYADSNMPVKIYYMK